MPATPATRNRWKPIAFAVLAILVVAIAVLFRDQWTLAALAQREAQLEQLQHRSPIVVYAVAGAVYVVITGLSLPGAAALSLLYAWFFGFLPALILVSFASTAGATLAFLSSRYLLREAVESRYGESMQTFRRHLDEEGAFYLFTLRLIPAVPFFLINLVMGLTPVGVWTFWWVSQIGMLPGTAVYVYAGSRVPDLDTLAREGVRAVFEPSQLLQLMLAFAALGVFPWAVRKLLPQRSRP
jgi:uncharacterized membrane protein YdjX (TVP38/TMEM64 family)